MNKKIINKNNVYNESFNEVRVVIDDNGYVTNKKYQVVFVDEYNNWYLIGFFNNLKDAEPELNNCLHGYELDDVEIDDEDMEDTEPQFGEGKSLGELTEYAGTFNPVFDRTICTTCGYVAVRGFVF